jgi:cobalt/nickel transport protein
MPLNREEPVNKLLKRIIITLVVLVMLTPVGILLPMFVDAGDAWGEWSARTMAKLIGYVPWGLAKYEGIWKAPLAGYTSGGHDTTVISQSFQYLISGVIGAALTLAVAYVVSKMIIRNGK